MLQIHINQLKLAEKNIDLKLDLDLQSGQSILLSGQNGIGKTSLIKSILGFQNYKYSGEIKFKNTELSDLAINDRVDLGIGVVFQLPPRFKNTSFVDLLGESEVDPRWAIELSQRLNIKDFLHQNINQNLSGGEQKRTELWQALITKPDLIILDELDSGVDAKNLDIMLEVLESYLKDHQKAAMIVTHSPVKYERFSSGVIRI